VSGKIASRISKGRRLPESCHWPSYLKHGISKTILTVTVRILFLLEGEAGDGLVFEPAFCRRRCALRRGDVSALITLLGSVHLRPQARQCYQRGPVVGLEAQSFLVFPHRFPPPAFALVNTA
jgi:hypothetical protein